MAREKIDPIPHAEMTVSEKSILNEDNSPLAEDLLLIRPASGSPSRSRK
jgi:hypothetical protein